jgi:hypothetical protein
MWHKVLTRMRKRSAAWKDGASTSLAGAGGWTDGHRSKEVARSLRRIEREKAVEEEATATGGR